MELYLQATLSQLLIVLRGSLDESTQPFCQHEPKLIHPVLPFYHHINLTYIEIPFQHISATE